jgi:hypothetical protein
MDSGGVTFRIHREGTWQLEGETQILDVSAVHHHGVCRIPLQPCPVRGMQVLQGGAQAAVHLPHVVQPQGGLQGRPEEDTGVSSWITPVFPDQDSHTSEVNFDLCVYNLVHRMSLTRTNLQSEEILQHARGLSLIHSNSPSRQPD